MCRIDLNAKWSDALELVVHLPIQWVNVVATALDTTMRFTHKKGASLIMVPQIINAQPRDKWLALSISLNEIQHLHSLLQDEHMSSPVFIFHRFKDHGFNYMVKRLALCPDDCTTVFVYDIVADTMQSIYVNVPQPPSA
jgi:hypothetical protein